MGMYPAIMALVTENVMLISFSWDADPKEDTGWTEGVFQKPG